MSTPDKTCATCRWWLPGLPPLSPEGPARGTCRCRAPVMGWTPTEATDWCGDHAATLGLPPAEVRP